MPPHPPSRDSLDRKLAVFGCLCVFLASLFSSYADVLRLYIKWRGEDSVAEIFTAACLFLAGVLLFALAKKEKARLRRCVYLLGGLAMAFACGEELSWGQHIFDFTTPDFLIGLNTQQEFNFHNIGRNSSHLRHALSIAPSLAAIVVCAAFLRRKEKIFGVALPSLPLTLSCLLASYPGAEFLFRGTEWPSPVVVLLLFFFTITLFSKHVRHCIFTAALLSAVAATLYARHRCNWYPWHSLYEKRESLLALVCLFYAAELWRTKGGRNAASWRPLRRLAAELKVLVRRLPPPWLMASALMAAGSLGLAASAHLASKANADAFASDLRQIMAAEPIARSGFDVHGSEFDVHLMLMEGSLIYFKEPCNVEDLSRMPFFVHVHPADPNDLPEHRAVHGFDNLGFNAFQGNNKKNVVILEGKCIVKRRLRMPKNRVGTRIITGQYLPSENRRLWEAEFTLSQ